MEGPLTLRASNASGASRRGSISYIICRRPHFSSNGLLLVLPRGTGADNSISTRHRRCQATRGNICASSSLPDVLKQRWRGRGRADLAAKTAVQTIVIVHGAHCAMLVGSPREALLALAGTYADTEVTTSGADSPRPASLCLRLLLNGATTPQNRDLCRTLTGSKNS